MDSSEVTAREYIQHKETICYASYNHDTRELIIAIPYLGRKFRCSSIDLHSNDSKFTPIEEIKKPEVVTEAEEKMPKKDTKSITEPIRRDICSKNLFTKI